MPQKVIRDNSNGFTLVELLLGALIAAVVGLTVASVFSSGMRLDERLRWVHENYTQALIADFSLSRDLENAITLDLSAHYEDLAIFVGKRTEMAFLTVTPAGIKRVRYFSGLVDWGKATKTLIGRKTGHLQRLNIVHESVPVEFLLREEMDLGDWLNGVKPAAPAQIMAAGIKKGTWNCVYAARTEDFHPDRIEYKDEWEENGLPLGVSCNYSIYDPRQPQADAVIKRDFFLPMAKQMEEASDGQFGHPAPEDKTPDAVSQEED